MLTISGMAKYPHISNLAQDQLSELLSHCVCPCVGLVEHLSTLDYHREDDSEDWRVVDGSRTREVIADHSSDTLARLTQLTILHRLMPMAGSKDTAGLALEAILTGILLTGKHDQLVPAHGDLRPAKEGPYTFFLSPYAIEGLKRVSGRKHLGPWLTQLARWQVPLIFVDAATERPQRRRITSMKLTRGAVGYFAQAALDFGLTPQSHHSPISLASKAIEALGQGVLMTGVPVKAGR